MSAKPHYSLAILGEKGSGKTSLIRRMLLGKYISQPELIDERELNHLSRKAINGLRNCDICNFDPFYRVSSNHANYWNENVILNIFDSVSRRPNRCSGRWMKGVSFSDGIVYMVDISKLQSVDLEFRDQFLDETIGKYLLSIFATSSPVQDLIIVINKMDLVDNFVELFNITRNYIKKSFKQLKTFRKTQLRIIPMSIKCNENIDEALEKPFEGNNSLLSCIRELKPYPFDLNAPFRMIHFGTYSLRGLGRTFFGKVISGSFTEKSVDVYNWKTREFLKSPGQYLSSFNHNLSEAKGGELVSCYFQRVYNRYTEFFGPKLFYNKNQMTCKPCESYFVVKLTGPVCNMKFNPFNKDLIILFFGYKAKVDLISKFKLYNEEMFGIFKFKQDTSIFPFELFSEMPEMSRITLFLNGIIGYGIITEITNDKYYPLCHSLVQPRLFDSHFHDLDFLF